VVTSGAREEAMTEELKCEFCGCRDESVKWATITGAYHRYPSQCDNSLKAKVNRLEAFVAAYDDWCQRGLLVVHDPDFGLTSLRHAREELDK